MHAYARKSSPDKAMDAAPRARLTAPRNTPQLQPASPTRNSAGFDFSRISMGAARAPVALQAKLAIGEAADEFEREADRAAEQVVRMPERGVRGSATDGGLLKAPLATAQTKSAPSGGIRPMSAPPIVHDVLSSHGQPLDAATRAFMEPRFGHDFSKVRIHAGGKAADSANAVNAKAYTVGTDVVMGAGQYSPSTAEGRKLLGHELAHVVQQMGRRDRVQRLIRTPYPWKGVILPDIGANIRKAAGSTEKEDVLVALPKGEIVTVLSAMGEWLKIETGYTGKTLQGWVRHNSVDDATAASMKKSVGTEMTWKPSNPQSLTDFRNWANAAKEVPFPAITSATIMNCWEAILLAGYNAKVITWQWIHDLYATNQSGWPATMSKGALKTFDVPAKPKQEMPQRGDIVFFNDLAHVALATGNGSEVYTFWPPPEQKSKAGTVDKVKTESIEIVGCLHGEDLADETGRREIRDTELVTTERPAELTLVAAATYNGAIGYAETFECEVKTVLRGSLTDKTIQMILMGDRNEIAFFDAHAGKGEIELDFAPRATAAGFDPFTGFTDRGGRSWDLISFREHRER